ncbi:hypothetical protein CP49_05490 [Bradyrhizobium valentinum]|uniref:Uncharacterized protein n=1 Tax=Bradyrhizobium valentinum TaxID=1518501 RepID=A0A0R3L0I2_9BRAD|nr:hypothetical protein CP49_05490 [Bradyrhizobium valentinum]
MSGISRTCAGASILRGSRSTQGVAIAADVFDDIGFAAEHAADHQKGASRAEPVQLLDDRLGCRPSEHDLIHRAEYDTTFIHGCPPRTFFGPCYKPWRQG